MENEIAAIVLRVREGGFVITYSDKKLMRKVEEVLVGRGKKWGKWQGGDNTEIDCPDRELEGVQEFLGMCRDEEIHIDELTILVRDKRESPYIWKRISLNQLYERKKGAAK
jgi:hypothetical protein